VFVRKNKKKTSQSKQKRRKLSSSSSSACLPFLPLPLDVLAHALRFLSLHELSASAIFVSCDFRAATYKAWERMQTIQISEIDIEHGFDSLLRADRFPACVKLIVHREL
jgi:hypothetical protein